ncbi:glycine betaine ABC transporter substrate-binding protein [Pseudalkalibacillus hwajinpoensis]|uniref:Glycine/betaine ABC transporter substrate-binding protein n=1 Tax=Guptibacillus hwajinpoensis TaxID=208199 RepID=A0A4U1MDB8_9BACL|nr:glycine betaine ABC transporter substrate-binding protein [Pseudalkalibacillus hwajinpoensis]TKD68717.1 glycine/betaine ABC transporter substrate-binding protein [Pseudalkalibacillus hwajinpoensis]
MKRFAMLLIGIVMVLAACGGDSGSEESDPIVISGKPWTEQYILPHLLAEYIKANSDYEVEVDAGVGEVNILQQALVDGDIDMYVEYTGTGLEAVLKESADSSESADEIFKRVKKGYKDEYNLVWLEPLGFENGYTLALTEETNEGLNAETFSDLIAKSEQMVFGAPHAFYEREDGYETLVNAYGFNFKGTESLDPNIMYDALNEGEVDVIPAFTTDGRIARFNLVTTKDDKQFFPPYYAAPVVRQEVLDSHPDLEKVVNEFAGNISEEEMAEMNAKVDMDGKEPEDVAVEFLKNKGLID